MSKRIITAIDVGSTKVTTVIAALENLDAQPTVIGVYSHPSQGIKKGVIVNIDEATNSISESLTAAERMAGVTVSDVYVTINGDQITSINNRGVVAVSGGEITMEDTYRAIDNARTLSLPQDMNPIHIIPREFVVDNQSGIKYPIGMSGQRLEVETHIITASVSTWKNLKKCIEQLGLTVLDMVFTGWASTLSVLTDTERELGVTLLDIGGGSVSIAIFQEGAIVYSGSVPLGGTSITSDLAIGLQLSLEEAEKVKVNMEKIMEDRLKKTTQDIDNTPALLRKDESEEEKEENKNDTVDVSSLGIQSKDKVSKSMINQIVQARLEEVFEMVSDNVSQAGFDVAMPAGVVLTGGTALLKDITKIAQAEFGVPARVGYPSGLSGMVEEISDPSYSAVQGLVKHAIEDEGEASVGEGGGSMMAGLEGITGKVTEWIKSLMP
jgi:cell division protein FtsA